ncbi:MAG TPA: signal peptidase I [Chloroflexota bacterium]|nr:signal peptidase I [Chloroflexota bacterium]
MTDSPPQSADAARKRGSWLRELVETAILTVLIFVAVRFALQNFRVDGMSMEPNFHNGEYVLVSKLDYLFHGPQRGDVVVFQAVAALRPDSDFIKRVIGVPGDTVKVRSGRVYVDNRPLNEPYELQAPDYNWGPEVVPKNDYFVLGDNRNNSYDSSKWPTPWVARKYIIGKAWVVYWPLSSLHFVGTPSYGKG